MNIYDENVTNIITIKDAPIYELFGLTKEQAEDFTDEPRMQHPGSLKEVTFIENGLSVTKAYIYDLFVGDVPYELPNETQTEAVANTVEYSVPEPLTITVPIVSQEAAEEK